MGYNNRHYSRGAMCSQITLIYNQVNYITNFLTALRRQILRIYNSFDYLRVEKSEKDRGRCKIAYFLYEKCLLKVFYEA